jgi:hypothetical protein
MKDLYSILTDHDDSGCDLVNELKRLSSQHTLRPDDIVDITDVCDELKSSLDNLDETELFQIRSVTREFSDELPQRVQNVLTRLDNIVAEHLYGGQG